MARSKKERPAYRRDRRTLGEIVGQRVHEVRKQRRLTREELAKKADVSISALVQIEAGRPPRLTSLEAVARALHVRAADLLDGEAPPPEPVTERAGAKVLRRLIARLESHGDDEHFLVWVEGIVAAFERGHASQRK